MKSKYIIPLLSLMVVYACGDNHPFDEDYWDTPAADTTEETTAAETFTATITSLSNTIGTINGTVEITVNQTDSTTTTSLSEIPQSLMLGQRSISPLTCAELAASFPPPEIVNSTGEIKAVNTTDSGTREALIAELNQTSPENGDALSLPGKSYVIKAYIENFNTPIPQAATLIPIACGPIVVKAEGGTTGGTAGGTTGGAAGTVGGGATGTTVGGVDGTVGGTIGGTTGTAGGAAGTTGGGVDGTVGGSIGGSVGGSIGGTTGI